jgi:phasin family protein
MAQESESYFDVLRKFANEVGLPKVDVDKLIETQRKNILALGEAANVAAGGAQSVVQKQRDVLEAGLREASALVRDFKPLGNPQETLATQKEFTKKLFDIAVQGAQDSAGLARESTGEAVKVIKDRMHASLEEFRGSVTRRGG